MTGAPRSVWQHPATPAIQCGSSRAWRARRLLAPALVVLTLALGYGAPGAEASDPAQAVTSAAASHPAQALTSAAASHPAQALTSAAASHPAQALTSAAASHPAQALTASATTTFRPATVPFSATEIPNELRGEYAWLGQQAQPASYRAMDLYYRDQVMWNQIEPTPGNYDFTLFDNALVEANARGGTFGFRVMAYCPGCWRSATPTWMPLQAGSQIPDWNSPVFLTRWAALMSALSDRYADDPRLGWLDVGGYGYWGEWHTNGEGTPATTATMTRVIHAVTDNFPRQHVVMNAMNGTGVKIAMAISPRIGLRADCLGAPDMYSLIPSSPAMQERWKTAPVITEWCGTPSASTRVGAAQVRKYHVSMVSSGNTYRDYPDMSADQQAGWRSAVKRSGYRYRVGSVTVPTTITSGTAFTAPITFANVGSAPTYDAWSVELRLVDSSGAVAAARRTTIDLRTLLPGTHSYRPAWTVSAAPGTYRLALAVVDPEGYFMPLRLANKGRLDDGSYLLGSVRVVG